MTDAADNTHKPMDPLRDAPLPIPTMMQPPPMQVPPEQTVAVKIADGAQRAAKFTFDDGTELTMVLELLNPRRRLNQVQPDGSPIYDFEFRCHPGRVKATKAMTRPMPVAQPVAADAETD